MITNRMIRNRTVVGRETVAFSVTLGNPDSQYLNVGAEIRFVKLDPEGHTKEWMVEHIVDSLFIPQVLRVKFSVPKAGASLALVASIGMGALANEVGTYMDYMGELQFALLEAVGLPGETH